MATTWFDSSAAKKRLSQLDGELQQLQAERALIESVLKTTAGGQEPKRRGRPPGRPSKKPAPVPASPPSKAPKGRPPGRRSWASRVSLVGLVVDALRSGPPTGMTVAEIITDIAKSHPDRVSRSNASATVSAAVAQARKAKSPKIKVLKQGGPGVPSRYGAA